MTGDTATPAASSAAPSAAPPSGRAADPARTPTRLTPREQRLLARRRRREWWQALRCLFGTTWARDDLAPRVEEVKRGLDALRPFDAEARGERAPPDDAPLFLLGTSWRCGSTLLQRILSTDRRLMVWGEPMARFGLLSRLTEMLRHASPEWPPGFFIDRHPPVDDPSQAWIANRYPELDAFRESLRGMLRGWLAEPARARGHEQWGLKEVRLDAADALLLRWLFPRARFVVLVRDPFEALRSAGGFGPLWSLHRSWPPGPVDTTAAFAAHWDRLSTSWLQLPDAFGHVIVRYEELVSGGFDFRGLQERLGLRLEEGPVLARRIRGSGQPERGPLTARERFVLRRVAADGLSAFGYA